MGYLEKEQTLAAVSIYAAVNTLGTWKNAGNHANYASTFGPETAGR